MDSALFISTFTRSRVTGLNAAFVAKTKTRDSDRTVVKTQTFHPEHMLSRGKSRDLYEATMPAGF